MASNRFRDLHAPPEPQAAQLWPMAFEVGITGAIFGGPGLSAFGWPPGPEKGRPGSDLAYQAGSLARRGSGAYGARRHQDSENDIEIACVLVVWG